MDINDQRAMWRGEYAYALAAGDGDIAAEARLNLEHLSRPLIERMTLAAWDDVEQAMARAANADAHAHMAREYPMMAGDVARIHSTLAYTDVNKRRVKMFEQVKDAARQRAMGANSALLRECVAAGHEQVRRAMARRVVEE